MSIAKWPLLLHDYSRRLYNKNWQNKRLHIESINEFLLNLTRIMTFIPQLTWFYLILSWECLTVYAFALQETFSMYVVAEICKDALDDNKLEIKILFLSLKRILPIAGIRICENETSIWKGECEIIKLLKLFVLKPTSSNIPELWNTK